jgi:CheY-like chemotaxis protein
MDVPPLDPDTIRVLVVDDDVDTADSAVLVLKFLGFEAAAVYDGGVALEQARKLRPQAVLLDLAMPHLDGLHLAQEWNGAGSPALAPGGLCLPLRQAGRLAGNHRRARATEAVSCGRRANNRVVSGESARRSQRRTPKIRSW